MKGDGVASPAMIVARLGASLVGGWAFTWGFVTLGIVIAVAAGMGYEDAELLVYMLAFPLYLTLLCWAIAARRFARFCVVLAIGAAVMSGGAWLWAGAL